MRRVTTSVWTLIGPPLMSFLLLRVSGEWLLESSLKTCTIGYQIYVNRTRVFFPWPPRRQGKGMRPIAAGDRDRPHAK